MTLESQAEARAAIQGLRRQARKLCEMTSANPAIPHSVVEQQMRDMQVTLGSIKAIVMPISEAYKEKT